MLPRCILDFAAPQGDGPPLQAVFGAPLAVLQAAQVDEVLPLLDRVQAAAAQGRWCVGYLRYEAAPAFDPALQVHPAEGPLAWFAVYDPPPPPEGLPPAPVAASADAIANPGAVRAEWPPQRDRARFESDLAHIQQAIARGDLYQVNLTEQVPGTLAQGRALDLFAALRQAQPGGYALYLDTGEAQWLSVSPELFFDWDGSELLARPMKGTAPRGATAEEDAQQAAALLASPKERAENVMIVDLIRNDLSRLAEPFSVQVPRLFHLEALPTVWQMTSDVRARTRAGTPLAEVLRALFPCGSVTGAPKVQAMRLIHELEPGPRGVYCGALGVVRPGRAPGSVAATFNVPIRTVEVRGAALRCGIGSGITAGATAPGEWQEWQHKQAFLRRASAPFEVLETLALQDGALRHRARHLARMQRAARHFGCLWSEARVAQALQGLLQAHPDGLWRVRLLLDARGQVQAQAFAMEPSAGPVRLALAPQPFAAAYSEFVRFKTTRRAHYDAASVAGPGVFDTLLWNEAGELTECTRGNLAVQLDGHWLTPPLRCGLLDGVGREVALAEGRLQEGVVRVEDLPRATGLAFLNSLRGWLDATWTRDGETPSDTKKP